MAILNDIDFKKMTLEDRIVYQTGWKNIKDSELTVIVYVGTSPNTFQYEIRQDNTLNVYIDLAPPGAWCDNRPNDWQHMEFGTVQTCFHYEPYECP
jgi:hypothetical protein